MGEDVSRHDVFIFTIVNRAFFVLIRDELCDCVCVTLLQIKKKGVLAYWLIRHRRLNIKFNFLAFHFVFHFSSNNKIFHFSIL